MDIVLAPDVYVNASVALGSPPDAVVQRVLGKHKGESKTTPWIMQRVEAILRAVPSFKQDAIKPQIDLIKGFVVMIDEKDQHAVDAWESAMVCAAKAANAKRVVTDHPDLLAKETVDGIDFISTEAWLLEQQMPPPPPPPGSSTRPNAAVKPPTPSGAPASGEKKE
jgi:hypothetical protein